MRKQYLYISIALFAVSILLFIAMFSGCAHSPEFCPECLQAVEDRPCVPGKYTCLHKSGDYCQCLKKQGYDARIVIGDVRGCEVPHAWIEIHQDEKIYWEDPTWGWGCWEKSKWGDRSTYY